MKRRVLNQRKKASRAKRIFMSLSTNISSTYSSDASSGNEDESLSSLSTDSLQSMEITGLDDSQRDSDAFSESDSSEGDEPNKMIS